MDDLLTEFLTETAESLNVLDVELVKLERDPNDPRLLSNIFRLVHTIKGTCGFLGLPRLEAVAHAGENVLGKFRDGELIVTPGAVTLILAAIDRIKWILSALEATAAEPEGEDGELIAALDSAAAGNPIPVAGAAPVAAESAPAAPPVPELAGTELAAPEAAAPESAAPALAVPELVSTEIVSASGAVPVAESKAKAPVSVQQDHTVVESAVAQQSIRVNVDLLESLMTTVSELVLTRNQLMQIARTDKSSEFATPLQRLNQVVSELQEGVMKTRMQQIGNAWAKLPRIIRDLSHELKKKIDLVMHGAETELDRQVLELIKDPLTHMVRNAADHGIELPEDRVRAGKAESGTIKLNAFHRGGHIILEISDDGRGLNIAKIKAKILSNGLASEAELAGLSDMQIQQFIFRAGFSTAEKVTSVSGRGVGMDVVRTNIEKIGGTIELKSVFGQGSCFTIKIPLTLAIVSALIVEVAGERYAVPQISVVELVRASERPDAERRIERIKGAPVLRLRDQLLPLIVLEDLLELKDATAPRASEDRFVVVSQVGAQSFGMIVDRVFDTEEIVVKPVAPMVRHISLFSGNTILGDGSVIMILDPNGLASAVGQASVTDHGNLAETRLAAEDGAEQTTLLVFRAGEGGPKAVPLSLVARLEEFDSAEIERVGGQTVIQYRGRLTPLVAMNQNEPIRSTGRQSALVFSNEERVMALLVDEIVDIVEANVEMQLGSDVPGIVGSAIVAGRATDLIDTGYFVKKAFPDWFGQGGRTLELRGSQRILFVDDSAFFRNMLTPLMQVAGYEVTTVASGAEAQALCKAGEQFDAIISDLEMPGMSGFELASFIKSDPNWCNTPLLALSSLNAAAHQGRARDSGFDDYVTKFDRESFLAKLSETLNYARRAA